MSSQDKVEKALEKVPACSPDPDIQTKSLAWFFMQGFAFL